MGYLNYEVEQLFHRQNKNWPLAEKNYLALALVKTRRLSVEGVDLTLQFNPARIGSTTSKIDPQSIKERPCFLCQHHLPPEQERLPFCTRSGNEYLILCNPFPISPRHFTLADVNHTEQLIEGRILDMLELAEHLSDFILLYNGPKSGASAPDHFHFQACCKGFLPIQTIVESGCSISHYPIPALVLESEDVEAVTSHFHLLYEFLQEVYSQEPEPMFNILCWKSGVRNFLVVFPRKKHRPSQFFEKGEANILISPGAIDLGGVIITPLEKDYDKLTTLDFFDIIGQLSIDPQYLTHISHLLSKTL